MINGKFGGSRVPWRAGPSQFDEVQGRHKVLLTRIPLLSALPIFSGRVPLTNDIVLLAMHTLLMLTNKNPMAFCKDLQAGLVSSHFFFLLLHVMQPVFERPFGDFVSVVASGIGCFRGLPRGRLTTAVVGGGGAGTETGGTAGSGSLSTSSSSLISSSLQCSSGDVNASLGEGLGDPVEDRGVSDDDEELKLARLEAPKGKLY